MTGGARHLYVHLPFCAHRCGYCDFVTVTGRHGEHGAYVDALLKTAPGAAAQAREALAAFPAQLSSFGTGSIGEICDADSPHLFRGCIAQAWSVAEVLRAWKKTKAPA